MPFAWIPYLEFCMMDILKEVVMFICFKFAWPVACIMRSGS